MTREERLSRKRENSRKYRAKNKELLKLKHKAYYEQNKDVMNVRVKQYHQDNYEQVAQKKLEWHRSNKGKTNASAKKYRTGKEQRLPKWLVEADLLRIQEFYTEASRLTELTGIAFHVDHEIPLHGELVSGLHHPLNLQILLGSENISKSNNYSIH